VVAQAVAAEPAHVSAEQKEVWLEVGGDSVRGAVKLELWDYDKRSADDQMCWSWFHVDMLPPDTLAEGSTQPALSLTKNEVDGPHLDKKGVHFDAEFRLEVFCRLVAEGVPSHQPTSRHKAVSFAETMSSESGSEIVSMRSAPLSGAEDRDRLTTITESKKGCGCFSRPKKR
jgi:hypothetical protein